MKKTEKLFILAEKLGIKVYFKDLSIMNCLGLYVEIEGMKPSILIDYSIKNDEEELSRVLAEELGHHYTYVGNSVSDSSTYRKRLEINKCELKAEKWICEYEIPEEDLINAVNANPSSIDDICNYLNVDTETLIKRLEFLSKKKQSLDLGNNKFLMLTNLPNIYVYDAYYF